MLAWISVKSNKGSHAARSLRRPWVPAGDKPPQQDRATFHLPADLLNEMRNAVVALSGPPNRLTMSKFAENAIRRELERLRRQGSSNASVFSQREGEVTRGRPIR